MRDILQIAWPRVLCSPRGSHDTGEILTGSDPQKFVAFRRRPATLGRLCPALPHRSRMRLFSDNICQSGKDARLITIFMIPIWASYFLKHGLASQDVHSQIDVAPPGLMQTCRTNLSGALWQMFQRESQRSRGQFSGSTTVALSCHPLNTFSFKKDFGDPCCRISLNVCSKSANLSKSNSPTSSS